MEYKLCQCVEPEDLQNGNLGQFVSMYAGLVFTISVLCWKHCFNSVTSFWN